MILVASLLLLVVQDGSGSEDTCSVESPLEICNFDVKSWEVPGEETELSKFCKEMSSFYSCYDEHYEEFASKKLCGYALLMRNAESVIMDLCRKDSTLQKSYLKSASCFKELSNKWDDFAKKNDRISDQVIDAYRRLYVNNTSVFKLTSCIKLFQKTHAWNDVILEECGADSMLLYHVLLRDIKYHSLFCTQSEYKNSSLVFRRVLQAILDREILPSDLFSDVSYSSVEK